MKHPLIPSLIAFLPPALSLRFLPLLLTLTPCLATGAGLTLQTTDKQPPADIAPSIRELLTPQAIQLLNEGKPAWELWFRTAVPLTGKPTSPAESLENIKDTTLLGAAVIHTTGHRDYKDNEIPAGTYTVRFGFQPVDGDHLGSSLYPYFALLIPAEADTSPDAITRSKQMSKASGKSTASGHPVVLSIRPASPAEKLPALTEPADDHKAIHLVVNAKPDDSDAQAISFELVFHGHGEIQ